MCTIQIFNAYARVRRFVFSVGEKARGRRRSQQPAELVTAKPDRQRERSKALDRFFSCSWFNLETCKTCSIFSSASTAVSTRFISEMDRTQPKFLHFLLVPFPFQLFNAMDIIGIPSPGLRQQMVCPLRKQDSISHHGHLYKPMKRPACSYQSRTGLSPAARRQ